MNKIAQVPIGETFFGKSGAFLSKLTDLGTLVSLIASNAIMIAGVVLLFLVVFAAYKMITSSGDVQRFNEGKNIITTAVIGFIIVVGAFLIVRLIESSLGVTILGP